MSKLAKRVMQGLLPAVAVILAVGQSQAAAFDFNLFSREQEIQIGRETAAEMEKELPVLPESHPASRYVRELGQRLAAHAPGPEYPFTFKVVNQKEINAFALPGGPVYVNVGVLQAATSEAEVAGVLAHEISHITERHATENASKQLMVSAPLQVLGGMLGGGMGAQLARLGISFGMGSVFLKYSRDAESEADRVGARIMYDTDYNPQAMVDFFHTLEEQGGARGPEFLSSHPNPGNRAEKVSEAIRGLPAKNYRGSSSQFRQVKQEVANLKPSSAAESAPAQQQAEMTDVAWENVRPSSNFQRFQHNAYRVGYPSNWQVAGDTESVVTIAPPKGVSNNAIAYGVIIGGFEPQGATSLERATDQLIERLRRGNPEMRTLGQGERIRVNGVPGYSVDLSGVSPLRASSGGQQRERDWLVTLQRDQGGVVYVLFVSPERDFRRILPTYEEMLRTLRLR